MRAILTGLGLVALAACVQPKLDYVQPSGGRDARTGLGQLDAKLAGALRGAYRGQVAVPHRPIELVDDDGVQLPPASVEATIAIDGPLAHTELRLQFHNSARRIRASRFSIALPVDASVTRFAMTRHGRLDESTITRSHPGHRAPPALLERDHGNWFSARADVGPSSDQVIVIGYDQRVDADYTLELAGLPSMPVLTATVTRDGVAELIDLSGRAPQDLVLETRTAPGVAAGEAFVVRIPATFPLDPDPLEQTLILVDTSASRAKVMGRQAEVVQRLVEKMAPGATVAIAAFDNDVTELYRGAPSATAAVERLFEHGALGASDLGTALARAAGSGMTRLVIVGDGMPTLGEHDPARLAALVAGTRLARIDAVHVGPSVDRDTLAALVRAGARPGAIVDGRAAHRAAAQLVKAMPREERITVDGAVATWPSTTRGIAPGEPIWVYGLHPSAARGAITVRVGEHAFPVASKATGDTRRVRRAVAGAEVADLTASLSTVRAEERASIGERVERIALEHGLVSTFTAMMFLDSDAQGQRDAQRSRQPEDPRPRTFGEVLGPALAANGSDENFVGGTYISSCSWATPYQPLAGNAQDHQAIARATQANAFALGTNDGIVEPKRYAAPYTGTLRRVMQAISEGERGKALELAGAWQLANPDDLAATIALGEALEARGASALAARAYASIIDIYPRRPELVRAAGERMERLTGARAFAIDAYRRSLRANPDHPTTYRLLAFALVRDNRPHEALDVLDEGIRRAKQQSALQVLAEDAGLVAAHVVARDPGARTALEKRVRGPLPTVPSMRIVLSWDDGADVDLHVHDRRGNNASHENLVMSSGGRLREGTGNAPELFSVDRPYAFPYQIEAHSVYRGTHGIGLGTAQVIRHDGKGNLEIEHRPFVVQTDDAIVDLGIIKG